ncbi:MAG: EAL domain-containing protein [Deferribacterales bacterium]
MKFAVCFHHTSEDIAVWKKFSQYLSEKLGDKIDLITFNSHKEEKEYLDTEEVDLLFENPEITIDLTKKGYLSFARLDNQWDLVCFVAKKNFEIDSSRVYKVGFVPLRFVYASLLELEKIGLSITKLDFVYANNLEILHSMLLNGEVDIILTRLDSFIRLNDEIKNNLKILIEFGLGIFHSFLLHPKHKDNLKLFQDTLFNMHTDPQGIEILNLLFADKIVPLGYELLFLQSVSEIGQKIFELRSFESMRNALHNMNDVGLIIYQDNIVYANKFALSLLDVNENDIKNYSFYDLLKFKTNKIAIGSYHDEVAIKTKTGKTVYLLINDSPIIYEGKKSRLVIFSNITRKVILDKMVRILKDVNHLITEVEDEQELFDKICHSLVDNGGFKFVWVGKFDKYINSIKPVLQYGDDSGYLEETNQIAPRVAGNNHCTSTKALMENNILLQLDTSTENDDNLYKESKLKRGFLSQASIPITKNNNPYAVITIYSEEPDFFAHDTYEILDELKRDISYALEKIEKNDNLKTFFNAIDKSNEWAVITDRNGFIEYVNNTVCSISGYTKDELIGRRPNIFKSGYHDNAYYEDLWNTILSGKIFSSFFHNRAKDGRIFYIESIIIPVLKKGKVHKFVSIGKDITLQIMLSEEVNKLKYSDVVSGAFNFAGFKYYASQALTNAKKNSETSGLILLDIYKMGFINSTYGIQFGDKLLNKFASILKSLFRDDDIIGRLGNDDFAILCTNLKNKNNVLNIITKILNAFEKPIKIDDLELKININIGVVVYPIDGEDINDLVAKAKLSLSRAIKLGENRFEIFDKSIEKLAEQYFYLEHILTHAVEENRYVLYYQPYYDTHNLEIYGVEALVRLKDTDGKILSPAVFIDYLEQSYHLEEFERWLLKKAIEFIKKYKLKISINLSARNLNNTILSNEFENIPYNIGMYLTLEITEREYIENVSDLPDKIINFKNKTGIKISLDDFGTGQSSLYAFKNLPVDYVKIDMIFIKDLAESTKSRDFVSAIVEICKIFNLTTIAEGVETEEQLNILIKIGCDIVQGYYLAKPSPEEMLPFYKKDI